MQITQYRRGILLPLDDRSEVAMRSCVLESPIRVEHVAIDDNTFLMLWNARVFRAINTACGSLIDEYEEALLEPGQIPGALAAVRTMKRVKADVEISPSLEMLEHLLARAVELHRPVMFVL